MKKTLFLALFAILTIASGLAAQTADPDDRRRFGAEYDAFIRKALVKIPIVPSAAIVVVKDDQPIFLRAYGMANKEAGIKADVDTLYYIASSTKSFTALAAALLDKEGMIKLSDPVSKYTAAMQLRTPIPERVTVRDLLTHTSGLENDALTFRMAYSGDSDPSEMRRVFAAGTNFAEANYGKYKYDNLGYNIYAVLLQSHLKLKWKDLLQKRIFEPLGLNHTTAYISRAGARKWSLAAPYRFDPTTGKMCRSPLAKKDNNLQSAGGVFASIADIGRWLNVNMNGGRLNGEQVFPAEIIRAAHTGYTRTVNTPPFGGEGEYGLGWQIGKYKNEKVIYHNGGFPGYRSHISFIPEKKIAVAVLVNDSYFGGSVGNMIATYAYDRWLGSAEAEAEAEYEKRLTDLANTLAKVTQQQIAAAADRAKRTSQLTKPLAKYSGRYVNEFLGTIDVRIEGSDLALKMGNIDVVSTPFTSPETIRVEMVPGTGRSVKFNKATDERIESLTYDDTIFKKVS